MKIEIEFSDEQLALARELAKRWRNDKTPLPEHLAYVDMAIDEVGTGGFSRDVSRSIAIETAIEMTEKGILGLVYRALEEKDGE